MFDGPLQQVKYIYVDNPYDSNGDGNLTAVLEERWATVYTDPGVLVSRVEMLPNTWDVTNGYSEGYWTRLETRGDGAARTISYFNHDTNQGQMYLDSVTDYFNNPSLVERRTYDLAIGHFYPTPTAVTDLRGNTTTQTLEPVLGNLTKQTYPDNSYRSWTYTDPANPYYVAKTTDELLNPTTYTRNPTTHLVTRIDYPDGGFETFSYNSFGQVLTHQMTSGGTESFTYDGRSLKLTYRDPAHQTGNPTWRYLYDSLDRLASQTDARGASNGDPAHSTFYTYNGRHQITKLTHPDGTYIQYGYDGAGNRTSVTNELFHTTTFVYDDYRRVISTTDPLSHKTTNSYVPWGQTDSYVTASSFIYSTKSPSGKEVDNYADDNLRRIKTVEGAGTTDAASTNYFYDPNGNLLTMTDPNGQTNGTSVAYTYDNRDRKTTATDQLGHKTTWTYDVHGNMKKETRADAKFRTWDIYDAMNRIKQTTGFISEITKYDYDDAGNMTQLTDAKGAIYTIGYDTSNRKTSETYPPDAAGVSRTEHWSYDTANNLYQYTNPAGQIETYLYDSRDRRTNSSWSGNSAQAVTTVYDAASRVSSVTSGTTAIVYGYDNANRKISEDQTVGGVTHRVNTPADSDGNRQSLNVMTGTVTNFAASYDYTARQQLFHIYDGGGVNWFQYTYDASGNVLKRQNKYAGSIGGDATVFVYDNANRVALCQQNGSGDVAFSWTHYGYDSVNNLLSKTRDEPGSSGEVYTYYDDHQMKTAAYGVTPAPTPTPTPPPPTPTPKPVITVQPVAKTVMVPQTATFSVTATVVSLSYQWKKNSVNVSGGTGGTAATYTTPATVIGDNGALFSVVVTNPGGSVTSNSAKLTVNPSPTPTPTPYITGQPQPKTVQVGQTASFSVSAIGGAPLAYQWKKGGVNVSGGTGGTTSTYTTPATVTADNGALFSVVVSNGGGTVTSTSAKLTVSQLPLCAVPTFNPTEECCGGGKNPQPFPVVFSTATSGAQMHYTTDGSTPTASSPTTSGSSFTYTVPAGQAKTIKAYAFKSGMTDSAVTSGDYDNTNSGLGPVRGRESNSAKSPGSARAEENAQVQPVSLSSAGNNIASSNSAVSAASAAVVAVNQPGSNLNPVANSGAGSKTGQKNSSGRETNTVTPHTVTYTLGPLNRQSVTDAGVVTTYGAASGMNQYPAVGGLPLTYDTNFNLASYNGWSYVFDAAGQMTSASASGHTASFVYDGLGRCVQRTIDGVVATITYDGWKPIYEWSSTGGQIAWNLYGPGPDEILWRNQAGGIGDLHYQTDHEGSVYFIRGPANAVREQYTYDAFGKPAIADGNGNSITDSLIGNRFMFTGREYLTVLGIYDYRHRMYHPVLGRFLETDPKGFDAGDYNLFRYCYNDPLDRIDPMGMESPGGAAERAAEIERNHNGIFDVDNAPGLHSGTTGSSIVTSAGWGSGNLTFGQTSKGGGTSDGPTYKYVRQPSSQDDHGIFQTPRFQLTDSKGNPIKDPGYSNRESVLSHSSSGNINLETTERRDPVKLSSKGVLTDRVGLRHEPDPSANGISITTFRNDLFHDGLRAGQVSTVFKHEIHVVNGQVKIEVTIVTP